MLCQLMFLDHLKLYVKVVSPSQFFPPSNLITFFDCSNFVFQVQSFMKLNPIVFKYVS